MRRHVGSVVWVENSIKIQENDHGYFRSVFVTNRCRRACSNQGTALKHLPTSQQILKSGIVDYTLQVIVVYTLSNKRRRTGIMLVMTSTPQPDSEKRNVVCTRVGQRLKQLRISLEMSQETLAFAAGVDRTYVSEIERGTGNPSLLTLANLCYALGITLDVLFEGVDVALPPREGETRRANVAQPKPPRPKIPKSRLR